VFSVKAESIFRPEEIPPNGTPTGNLPKSTESEIAAQRNLQNLLALLHLLPRPALSRL
jgi:hypothetical protein